MHAEYFISNIRDSVGLTPGLTRAIHSSNEKTLATTVAGRIFRAGNAVWCRAGPGEVPMKRKSRRQFLRSAVASTAGVFTMSSLPAWARKKAESAATRPLSLFGYSKIQLLDGPFLVQFDQNHKLFLNVDEDGLLKPFREREGLPAPGPDLGGWYDNANDFNEKDNFHGFIPGHSFGQYMSGLARAYAVTGSKPTQEKVQRLVRAYAATVEPSGKFYKDYRLPG
jgi:hypothetical protein